MARRVVACTACAATWTDRRARFCGRCGLPLAGPGDQPPGTDVAARRRRRLRLAGILATTVAAAVLAVAASVTDLLSFPRGGDPEVALPTPEVLPTGNRLEPDETRALRQLIDPDRLRCEPRGCELWRRARAFDTVRTGYFDVGGLGDLVVVFDGTDLVAFDRRTGDDRWVAPFDDLLPAGATVARDGESDWGMLAVLDDAVVVIAPQHVALVRSDGLRGWVTTVPYHLWGGDVVDDHLLLRGGGRGSARMWVIDLDDGRIVWERDATNTNSVLQDGRVLVSGDWGLEVVNLSDSEIAFSHEFGTDSPLPAGVHRDAWLSGDIVVVTAADTGQVAGIDMATGEMWTRDYNPSGWPMTASTWLGFTLPDSSDVVLVDSATGADLVTFPNANVNEWVEVDGTWVLLLTPASTLRADEVGQHQAGPRVVAIDGDGEVTWEIPIDMERRCCTWFRSDQEGVVAVMADDDFGGAQTSLRVDVASGTTLDVVDDADRGVPSWQATDGTWVEWGGTDDMVTLRRDGHSTRVFPGQVWPAAEGSPWIFASDSEIIGVQLMPDE